MIIITRPTGMKLRDWADQISMDLDEYGIFGKLMDDNKWQDWGVQLLAPMSLGGFNIPSPYQFDDWKEWAERVCGELA
jgi:hypothetical protein